MHIRGVLPLLLVAAPLVAQQTTAPSADFRWEKALPASSTVRLHNINGNVTVSPSSSDRVEIVGIKRGASRYFADVNLEVVEVPNGIVVCAMYRNADEMRCDEDGYDVRRNRDRRRGRDDDDDFDRVSIDIVVKLPKSASVSANSVSGDVTVTGAEGESVRGGSVSGDVRMSALRAATVRGSSVSGDVSVGITALTGDGELRFTSVSGNVTVELPRVLDADVSMRSVSGVLDSEYPLTLNGRVSRNSLSARIGKGGRELRVTTVSGDVTLRSARQ